MNRQKHKISWIIATWFGSGLLPKAPGTWGSLAAIPFAYLFSIYTCPYAQLFGITVLFFIGIWASDKIEESAQIKDPGFIVVDEVVGQWMAAYLFSIYTCPYAQLFGITVFFIGIWADKIEESAQIKDPGFIVVDEVVGQWMALLPLPFLYTIIDNNSFYLYSVPIAVAGFLVFRLFDIWKPWPVNYADKNIPGGYGIMFDDVIAGMYALIVTSVLTAVMVMICL